MPARQRDVLEKILLCRTPALGGSLYECSACGTHHYAYHSCNDRHCPQCGHQDAQAWLSGQQARLLLPVPYFLVTFTVPDKLRAWIRSHPQLGYDWLFEASAQALKDLAKNPKRLGAHLGFLGVLHTWSRTLIYHPHVHYLVPGGGLSLDGRSWVAARPKFLIRVEPLSDRFRTLFKEGLQKEAPELFQQLPAQIWKQRWVVHSQPAGSGQEALSYLSRYVFKTATDNRKLERLPNGCIRWGYRDSNTRQAKHLDLEPFELIRRFLQHVLPSGYTRVRCFGWFHPGGRQKLNRVRALLKLQPVLTETEIKTWQPPPETGETKPPESNDSAASFWPLCPKCRQPMRLSGQWQPGQNPLHPARAPP